MKTASSAHRDVLEMRPPADDPGPARDAAGPGGHTSGLADLLSSVDVVNPYPLWEELRSNGPIVAGDGSFGIVSSFADCDAILRSPDASSDSRTSKRYAQMTASMSPDDLEFFRRGRSFLFMDAPDHTRLRRLVSRAFTPRVVEKLHPLVLELCTEMIDAAARRGTLELVADLAHPLPVAVISALLGVPLEDRERFTAWSKVLARGLDGMLAPPDPESLELRKRNAAQFRDYFSQLAEKRRQNPTDDLFSALVAIEDDGDRLSADELVSTAMLILIAGHETTVTLIGNAALAIVRDDTLRTSLAQDPGLVNGFVEEVLRLDPPVQLTVRNALRPIALSTGTVNTGGTVLVLLAAAGRDPERYAEPLQLDPNRSDGGHLALGTGPHYCLGQALARLEARVVLGELARRLKDPVVESLDYRENRVLRGPERMVISFSDIVA